MIENHKSIEISLATEPEQMTNPWYYWIERALTLPIRIIAWPIRYILMSIIAPVTRDWLSGDNQNEIKCKIKTKFGTEFSIHKIDYKIAQNDECSMVLAKNKGLNNRTDEKKLVINFEGNYIFMRDRLYILQLVSKPINSDIIFVSYPKGATSSKELVDGGVSAILRAIDAGYKPENITIAGHSLGGAVSALAIKAVEPHLNGSKFAEYINHRSFTNLGDVIGAQLNSDGNQVADLREKAKSSWMGKTVNGLAWILGIQLDAEKAIKSSFPVEKITLHRGNNDEVIRTGASIAAAVENNEIDLTVPTTVITTQHSHNDKYSNTIYGAEVESESYTSLIRTKKVVQNQIPVI